MEKPSQKNELREQAEKIFYKGEKHREQKQWEQAWACYEEAYRLQPDGDFKTWHLPFNNWHRLGLTLAQLGRHADARPWLERALAEYKVNWQNHSSAIYLLSIAQIYALFGEKDAMLSALGESFGKDNTLVAKLYTKIEFEAYKDDRDFQEFMQDAIEQTKRKRRSFDVSELAVFGCDNCRKKASPPDHHDWTAICRECGNKFSYSGCSCDGCCGGTYAGFGGGRTTFYV